MPLGNDAMRYLLRLATLAASLSAATIMIGLAATSATCGARELSAARMDPGEGPFALYFLSAQTEPVSSGSRHR